jgi:DNA-directed RNA polymerase subunit RPC12/RpoP
MCSLRAIERTEQFSAQVRPMSKQSMREEAERLIRETMEKKALVVKQGNTRIETTCGKCGAPNRLQAEKGATRVKFACKQCGHKQETL